MWPVIIGGGALVGGAWLFLTRKKAPAPIAPKASPAAPKASPATPTPAGASPAPAAAAAQAALHAQASTASTDAEKQRLLAAAAAQQAVQAEAVAKAQAASLLAAEQAAGVFVPTVKIVEQNNQGTESGATGDATPILAGTAQGLPAASEGGSASEFDT